LEEPGAFFHALITSTKLQMCKIVLDKFDSLYILDQ
jgi:hypothetical protein